MRQYLDLLEEILRTGVQQSNRTGIDTLTLPGAMLKFDLRNGFPAITTKKLAYNQVKGELIGFIRGVTSADSFRLFGCKIWDQNANENPQWLANPNRKGTDDLGRIYGKQWRDFDGDPSKAQYGVDQLDVALRTLRKDPQSRRIIVSAWNPNQLNQMALPPCHLLFQLLPHVESKTLHMTMYQRSCDMFLGIPFNIASYATLLTLFAAWCGYNVGTLTMFLADAHIYTNHIDQVEEQLTRSPLALCHLDYTLPKECPWDFQEMPIFRLIDFLQPETLNLINYISHPPIAAPMAV